MSSLDGRTAVRAAWATIAATGALLAAAWATHVVHCIQSEQWLFLIAGAIAFPVAVVHGVGLWFGLW